MSYPLHIIGGSLYGILLALSLRSLSNDLEIHIHEKSDQFLSSWNNLTFLDLILTGFSRY